MFGVLGGP